MEKDTRRILIVAAWHGDRRTPDDRYDRDRGRYIRLWTDALSRLKHSLHKVVFVLNGGSEHAQAGYRDAIHRLPARSREADVFILPRANVGMSYGAWSDAFRWTPRGLFDLWYLFEDDWLPCVDDWDLEMGRFLEEDPGVGFVGSVVRESSKETPAHIGVGWGATRERVLSKVFGACGGKLPHDATPTHKTIAESYKRSELAGNVGFTAAVQRHAGLRLLDVRSRWRSGYVCPSGEIHWYFSENTRALVVPAHGLPGETLDAASVAAAEASGIPMDHRPAGR